MASGERRAGPYARVYLPWLRPLLESGALNLQAAVLLLLMSRLEYEGGRTWGWLSRAEIASRLGVEERTVSNAVCRLSGLGILSQRTAAHHGRAATYWIEPGGIMWPLEGTSRTSTFDAERYFSHKYLHAGKVLVGEDEGTCPTSTHKNKERVGLLKQANRDRERLARDYGAE